MSRKVYAIGVVGLGLTIAGTAGCPGGWPDPGTLSAALEYETTIGGNENRVVLMKQEYPELPPFNWWEIILNPAAVAEKLESLDESAFLPTTRLVMVDLDSLTLTPLTHEDIAVQPYFWGETDGRWLVWQEDDSDGVHVLDLETAARSVVMQDTQSIWIDQIEDGWLLAKVSRGLGVILLARNLASGDELNLLVNPAGWGASISGSRMAVQYFPDPFEDEDPGIVEVNTDDLAALLESNVDVLDLETGERQTVLTGLSDGKSARIGGEILWIEQYGDGGMTSLEAYNLQTDETTTMTLPPLPDPSAERYLEDVGPIGVLVSTCWYSENGSESHELWELWTPEGTVQTVLDHSQSYDSFSLDDSVAPWPEIVGSRLIYHDPQTADWVLYDPATGSGQAVRPFE